MADKTSEIAKGFGNLSKSSQSSTKPKKSAPKKAKPVKTKDKAKAEAPIGPTDHLDRPIEAQFKIDGWNRQFQRILSNTSVRTTNTHYPDEDALLIKAIEKGISELDVKALKPAQIYRLGLYASLYLSDTDPVMLAKLCKEISYRNQCGYWIKAWNQVNGIKKD